MSALSTDSTPESPYEFALTPHQFSSLTSKEATERLHRWGMADVLKVQRFKFTGKVAVNGGEAHVANDLLASTEFARHTLDSALGAIGPEQRAQLVLSPLSTSVTNMGFFDPLEKEELLAPNGYLRKCMNDRVAGVEIDTLVTDMLLNEDSEYAHIFTAAQRAEFVFQLFRAFFVGGAMHQRDEDVLEYLEQTKATYKELLTVHKKAASGRVEVTSKVLRVEPDAAATAAGHGGVLFPGCVPEHSRCFIVVDPVKKFATVVYLAYKSFW